MSPRSSISIFAATLSMQVTALPLSARQVPVTRPTYPLPTTAIFMEASPIRDDGAADRLDRRSSRPSLGHDRHRRRAAIVRTADGRWQCQRPGDRLATPAEGGAGD